MLKKEIKDKILECAYEDWRGPTGEFDLSIDGRLSKIFKDSGWANSVTFNASGRVHDWCGMAPCAWLIRSGMNKGFVSSFYHTMNIEDFATYGSPKKRGYPYNPKRLKTKVVLEEDGPLTMLIKNWHKENKNERVWFDEKYIRNTPLDKLDIQQADIILIDYQGFYDKSDDQFDAADHITMCASYGVMGQGILETIEGNAFSSNINGTKIKDSVGIVKRDLNDPKIRKQIYGILRLSDLDFEQNEVK